MFRILWKTWEKVHTDLKCKYHEYFRGRDRDVENSNAEEDRGEGGVGNGDDGPC